MPATTAVTSEALAAAFPGAMLVPTADGIPSIRVPVEEVPAAVERIRGELGYRRFVDVTAVDRLKREQRFELVYLFYHLDAHAWLRLKAWTDAEAPSITPMIPGADWYERELFDLFGIRFAGHPDLRRIMLPEDWQGHPLRRTEPLGSEPVDFTVTRKVYGAN